MREEHCPILNRTVEFSFLLLERHGIENDGGNAPSPGNVDRFKL
jgi:hypothetical protein